MSQHHTPPAGLDWPQWAACPEILEAEIRATLETKERLGPTAFAYRREVDALVGQLAVDAPDPATAEESIHLAVLAGQAIGNILALYRQRLRGICAD